MFLIQILIKTGFKKEFDEKLKLRKSSKGAQIIYKC